MEECEGVKEDEEDDEEDNEEDDEKVADEVDGMIECPEGSYLVLVEMRATIPAAADVETM